MTYEEAFKNVNEILEKRSPNFFVRPEPIYDVSFWLRIQEALEKQTPKKPIDADFDYMMFDCPSCGTKIYADNSIEDFRYCLTCGQAIDWSD